MQETTWNCTMIIPVFLQAMSQSLHQMGHPSNQQVIVEYNHVFGLTLTVWPLFPRELFAVDIEYIKWVLL